jgi:hypothetical protein
MSGIKISNLPASTTPLSGSETVPLVQGGVTKRATVTQIGTVTATGSTTPRTLPDRFADVVNVKDFGAIGDGVTDDAEEFTASLAAKQYITVPKGEYALGTAVTIDVGYKVEFDYGAVWTGSGFTGGGVLVDYSASGIGAKRRYNEQTQYIQGFDIDSDTVTKLDVAQFRVASQEGRNAIVGATVNDSAASDNTFPTGVSGYGKLNRDGNAVFGLFGMVEQYTDGVSTHELNTFNYKAGPPGTFPPDRSFGISNAIPVTLTVAAGGTYPSLIGVQICREGSVPSNYVCGIYTNPDAVTDFGVLVDADSTNGPVTSASFKTPGTNASSSNLFLQMTNSSPNAASRFLRCYNSSGNQLMGVKSDGQLAFDAASLYQSTVGVAGAASVPPSNPTGYLKVEIGGVAKVIPYYEP